MNRIVRERYPLSRLPKDLRQGYEGRTEVRVTVEAMPEGAGSSAPRDDEPVPGPGFFSQVEPVRRSNDAIMEEIDDHLRALRDAWDHRDR